ncbi:2055_t:CDS:1 [Cetraspora pellucida]|uniref:2055_t:CDS:1 n=1 Tax=Cetraspora pellucida TaxID=1433469 RepID=A0A9N9NZM9_9GLOM|nr:2055_t:CDS:1 [Cetraspora pellucida]
MTIISVFTVSTIAAPIGAQSATNAPTASTMPLKKRLIGIPLSAFGSGIGFGSSFGTGFGTFGNTLGFGGFNSEFGSSHASGGALLKKRDEDDDKQKRGENKVTGFVKREIPGTITPLLIPLLGGFGRFGMGI